MQAKRRILRGAVRRLFYVGFVCAALCSCSLFESNITPTPTAKIEAPPHPSPLEWELPYCAVDLDFPLSLVTKPKIYVLKEQRRLWLVDDKTLVRDYHIGLGPSPKGDKFYKGDGRTPEGEYFVCAKNASSRYYKSLGINYPSPRDAENALSWGLISYSEYCSIRQANDAMKLPPSDTALGGQVMIHGGGSLTDWTLGCIALQNRAMDELFDAVQIGTPVYIMP
ncbi:MAG TPA: L,D-transpeptidase [Syntrophobacteraceae bacterium]|nr:L,D-transpeptidase [Syntrophobacteraceae bacterium]